MDFCGVPDGVTDQIFLPVVDELYGLTRALDGQGNSDIDNAHLHIFPAKPPPHGRNNHTDLMVRNSKGP